MILVAAKVAVQYVSILRMYAANNNNYSNAP